MTAAEFAELVQARRNGDGWTARCPAHEDHKPSLTIAEGRDGRVLVKCQASCATEAVCAALGVDLTDLFPPKPEPNGHRTQVARYRYQDEHGQHLYDVVRFEPKDFRQCRPDGAGGWIWNMRGVDRVLYRLPQVLEAVRSEGTVWICEGEKDADALTPLLTDVAAAATTNPGGAGKWRNAYTDTLRGAHVVIVADRDDAGRKHATEIAATLKNVAASVSVVETATGKDAADHIAAGHGLGDFRPVNLASTMDADAPELRLVPLSAFIDVQEPTAEPLLGTPDETALAVGGDLLVYGTGGAGKTTWTIDGIAHLAAGIDWIGLPVPKPVAIALIENEGPRGKFRQLLKRKVAAWPGPPFAERVEVLEEPWGRFTFADSTHRAQLAALLNTSQTALLVCGPITALGMIGGGTPDEINAFTNLLRDLRLLLDHPVAVWLLHHENRAGQVSGAWERVPDTLVHVTPRGNGHTRIYWQKARWSSALHDTTLNLAWADGASYTIEDSEEAMTAERIWDAIASFVLAHGGTSWNPVHDAVSGNNDLKRTTRDAMLADGILKNAGKGKAFALWHREDPVRPVDLDGVRP